MGAGTVTPAAAYVRISKDMTGEALGVQRQEQACRDLAASKGWDVAQVFADNDVSATRSKVRPAYQSMLRAIESGQVSRVVVWDLDRLTRKPSELEAFMDLADRHRVELANVTGDVDLGTVHGRMVARIKGAVARAEVEKMSERLRAKFDQNVEQGKPTGRRPYGWNVDGTPRPDEADVVREIVRRIGAGEAVSEVVRNLNDRGVPAPASERWRTGGVRSIARRAKNIGMRVHRGKVVGEGPWLPLVTEAEHARALAVLDDPSRRTQAGTQPSHLLSGIATCAVCGSPLRAMSSRGRPIYQCRGKAEGSGGGFCVSRGREELDGYVTGLVLARLGRKDAARVLAPQDGGDSSLVDSQVAELRERQAAVVRLVARGLMPEDEAESIVDEVRQQIERVQAQASRGIDAEVLAPVIGAKDPEAAWQALTLTQQRRVVQVLFERVALRKTGVGRRTPIHEVVEVTWRTT